MCVIGIWRQMPTSTTVSIECIIWLIKVLIIMMHGGNLKLTCQMYEEYFIIRCSYMKIAKCQSIHNG